MDHALAISYRRNSYNDNASFVAHITPVRGTDFYGFHVGHKLFLKIYLFNPLHTTRLADLLRQGTVMKRAMQPYESHIQYILQWMCDYNLYGCAYIDCTKARFRGPIPEPSDTKSTIPEWNNRTVPASWVLDEDTFPRQSHCAIEVDICAEDITNRLEIKMRPNYRDFDERADSSARDEKLVHSMAELWRDETRRRKSRLGEISSSPSLFPPEVLVSLSAGPRNSQPNRWVHEEEYRKNIEAIVHEERLSSDSAELTIDGFKPPEAFDDNVRTAFESVEDLFSRHLLGLSTTKTLSPVTAFSGDLKDSGVDVDESRILSFKDTDYAYAVEGEIALNLQMRHDAYNYHLENHLANQVVGGGDPDVTRDSNTNHPHGQQRNHLNIGDLPKSVNPGSSAELELLGIRRAGVFNHVDDDAFEIPPEYASDIAPALVRYGRTGHVASVSKRPKKRRKMIYDEKLATAHGKGRQLYVMSSASAANLTAVHNGSLNHQRHRDKCLTGSEAYAATGSTAGLAGEHINDSRLSLPTFSSVMNASDDSPGRTIPSSSAAKGRQKPHTVLAHDLTPEYANSPRKLGDKVTAIIRTPPYPSITTDSDFEKSSLNATSKHFGTTRQSTDAASKLIESFEILTQGLILFPAARPPSFDEISGMMENSNIPSVIYQDAYYGNESDVPERTREYAGKGIKLEGISVPYLPDFNPTGSFLTSAREAPTSAKQMEVYRQSRKACTLSTWEFVSPPPTRIEVQQWLDGIETSAGLGASKSAQDVVGEISQIDGPSQKNKHGFKYTQKQPTTSVNHMTQYMSLMSLEVHVNTRKNLVPDPEQDEIACIFWCLKSDNKEYEGKGPGGGTHVGIIAVSEDGDLAHKISQYTLAEVEEEPTELDLINRMVDIVHSYDPDILTGFEVHGGSWGYVIERARCKYDYNLCDEFSRMKSQSHGRFGKEADRWGFNQTSTIRVTGRHMINIWRAMRGELTLLQYTMENIVFHLLHRRMPHFAFSDLTKWYRSNKMRDFVKVIDYFVSRVQLDLEILEENELISRTSEQARLLGIDFFSVFSRGSQFKVESLMFRIAKPENFILISPSRKQVGQQNALECLPLVMEPQSAFYSSPMLILDFQSLYPSVMIAYNYCYSTCLGRVLDWRGRNKMGFRDFKRQKRLLELFKDSINIAPNGILYVKPSIRKSLLAKMLGEILETRVMVKSGMKNDRDDRTLQRLLNNRQLALKLIANVTYGYTSASFSGRMPCSEIADSIVQTARETLERAIALIHSVKRWGAEVVYGDTDSIFVYLKGRTKDEAFDIGNEIAETITKMNPKPVKLKFEKVYLPCVLLAKKRYVGSKYETKAQAEPIFDAKGIETVRRDGTPAEQKIEEKALKILFRTADLSQVKNYFQKECIKIMKGKFSVQDFCFAKEVRLGTYSDKGLPPAGALISTRRMLDDPRAEPQYGERVPYVVIAGAPGARLIDRCVAPDVLLHHNDDELDAEYYICKNIIPPLERIFNLCGANVRQWYDEMPKFQAIRSVRGVVPGLMSGQENTRAVGKTLESYMKSSSCVVCRAKLNNEETLMCGDCIGRPHVSVFDLHKRLRGAEMKALDVDKVCRSCAGLAWGDEIRCNSKDCPVYYTRIRHNAELGAMKIAVGSSIEVLEAEERQGPRG